MRILVTGSKGQLGTELTNIAPQKHSIYGFDLDMDITKPAEIEEKFSKVKPAVAIHCAAITDVDGCEDKKDLTYLVNTRGTENLAKVCQKYGADLLFISSDYVFDGAKGRPYVETDAPNPLSVYGDSKYQAEKIIKGLLDNYYILRTTGIYSKYGKNFVDTVIKAGRQKEELNIVNDQICTPTYSLDLAECIYSLLDLGKYGIYHTTNNGGCSWYDFTAEIFKILQINTQLLPIESSRLGRKAKRPAFSVLENRNLESNHIYFFRHWREALKEYLTGNYIHAKDK
ncbi:MAG: dTDP-4-dehydrorhamnose reductase [Actinomycetota bacterium]